MPVAEFADAWSPATGAVRGARATAASLACVMAAATGHASAGGRLSPTAVLAVAAGAGLVAWLLSARRVAPTQIVGLLVLCQVCVHLGAPAHDMTMSATMITGHVAATAVSALLLSRGEGFVWSLVRRLGLRSTPLLGLVASGVPSSRRPVPATAPRPCHDVLLAHSRWLRGPPSGLV